MVFVLVRMRRRLFARPTAASTPAVGICPELVVWKAPLIRRPGERGRDSLHELGRDLIDEARRLAARARRRLCAAPRRSERGVGAPGSCRRSRAAALPRALPGLPPIASAGTIPPRARPPASRLEPLRAVERHQPDAGLLLDPCASSTSDSNDRRSTKPLSVGSTSRLSNSRAAETSSARFSMRASESSLRSSRRSWR